MAKSDPEFLQSLYEQSLRKQETFLENISFRLGRKRLQTPPPRIVKGAPDFWEENELPLEERVQLFMSNWRKAGGHAERFADMAEAGSYIVNLVRETHAKHLIVQNQPELAALNPDISGAEWETTVWNSDGADDARKDELAASAAGADIGIAAVDYAVACTGSVVVMSSPSKGRTVSLLPTAWIAIVPVERLKTRLGEVLRPLDRLEQKERPAGIHFISGPSRSADIENDLTIGVHGPGVVYALIVG